jgi:hypothetical protein
MAVATCDPPDVFSLMLNENPCLLETRFNTMKPNLALSFFGLFVPIVNFITRPCHATTTQECLRQGSFLPRLNAEPFS